MSKSLAELRAEAKPRTAERSVRLCLAQDLVSHVQALAEEKQALILEIGVNPADEAADEAPKGDDEKPKKPRRVGDPRTARVAEIEAELEALYAEMREHEGDLILRATSAGAWQRWVEENPPRVTERDKNNRPILNPVDETVGYGVCDASALLDDLGKYVATWNGEPVKPDDLTYLLDNAAPGDVKQLCRTVVEMHEGTGARAPKASSTSSSTTPTPATS